MVRRNDARVFGARQLTFDLDRKSQGATRETSERTAGVATTGPGQWEHREQPDGNGERYEEQPRVKGVER